MKTYLRQTEKIWATQTLLGYNHDTLERVLIWHDCQSNIEKFDTIEELKESIEKEFSDEDYQTELITREEFITLASEFTNRYNTLIKEL